LDALIEFLDVGLQLHLLRRRHFVVHSQPRLDFR